ncbi:MAG: hypothetical protein ACREJO_02545, partial [Phycisphaerales bacterium]
PPPAPKSAKQRRPGRKRRMAGWLLLAIGVLITGVGGASRWWYYGNERASWFCIANKGRVDVLINCDTPLRDDGWFAKRFATPGIEFSWTAPTLTPPPGRVISSFRLSPFVSHLAVPNAANGRPMSLTQVVLWPFALGSLLSGGLLLWSGRRARRRAMGGTGVCLKCGYDLRGLAAGSPCPECGGGGAKA